MERVHRQHESPPLKMREAGPPQEGALSTLSPWWCTSNKRIIREWVKAVQSSPCTTVKGEVVMAQNLVFSQLLWIALVLLCLLIPAWWPDTPRATLQRPLQPEKPRRTRSKEPTPLAGLIHQPSWDAGERAGAPRPQTPSSPPPELTFTRGRKRTIDTQHHFCPGQQCAYYD